MRVAKIDRKTEYFMIEGCNIKATNDKQGITEGYLNYIGNIDFGDDRTMPGAFKITLKDSYSRKSQQGLDFLWPYLWNHDYNILPPGGIFEANEDKNGLYIKTQYNLDMQLGRELYSSFKLGTMKKQSMGYKAIQVDWTKDNGRTIRNLLEVAVMEGSAVVFPMNDMADVTTVKNTLHSGRTNFYMPGKTLPTQQQAQQAQQQTPSARKDFNDRYQAQVIDDWAYSDWYDLTTALRQSIQDIFAVGDSPMADLENIILNDSPNGPGFITALRNYVQEGIDNCYSEYLQEQADANSASYGGLSGYMSNSDSPEAKAGRAINAAHMAILKKATDGIATHVKSIKSMMTAAQQQGYPLASSRYGDAHDDALPTTKNQHQEDDAAISTQLNDLLTSLNISNLGRKG